MLFKEGTVPMQTHLVSGGSPIMTSPQKPVVSNTLDPPAELTLQSCWLDSPVWSESVVQGKFELICLSVISTFFYCLKRTSSSGTLQITCWFRLCTYVQHIITDHTYFLHIQEEIVSDSDPLILEQALFKNQYLHTMFLSYSNDCLIIQFS